jgi:hypothetical protein
MKALCFIRPRPKLMPGCDSNRLKKVSVYKWCGNLRQSQYRAYVICRYMRVRGAVVRDLVKSCIY